MKKSLLTVTGALIIAGFTFAQQGTTPAQQDNTRTKSESEVKTQVRTGSQTQSGTGSQVGLNNDREKDLEFLTEAASAGLMEVELGKLAQQKPSSHAVKDYGRMMETHHSDANTKLKAVTQKLGVPVPSRMKAEHQENIDDLSKKSGEEFDKAYMDMMVKDHKEDINKFEDAQEDISDATIKQWVSSTLPVLKKHQQQAESIQEQIK